MKGSRLLPFNLFRLASIASAAVFAAGCMIAGGVSTAPNVVFVLLDGVDHRTAATANILPRIPQRPGTEGATFTRAYA